MAIKAFETKLTQECHKIDEKPQQQQKFVKEYFFVILKRLMDPMVWLSSKGRLLWNKRNYFAPGQADTKAVCNSITRKKSIK